MAAVVKQQVLNGRQKIIYKLLVAAGLLMTVLFGIWWFMPSHIPTNFKGWAHIIDILLFTLVSYVAWHPLSAEVFSWFIAKDMNDIKPMRPQYGKKTAFLTAFVPRKEPYDMLENTLRAMVNVSYPHDTWLLDEGNDPKAKAICKSLGVKHFSRKGIRKYNQKTGQYKAKTKAGNHNAWHDKHGKKYDFVAQIDVDFVPRKDFLTKTLGYFRDPAVGFVGTPQIYGNNEESWIADGAAQQSYGFFGPTQKGLFGKDMQLFIGANHIVRAAALKSIGGYSGHIVEDHLTGMKLYEAGWNSVYVADKMAVGEGPGTWQAYFSQQMRWAYGLIDILFNYSPKLLPKMKRRHALNYFLLQQHYFYGLAQAIGIVLLTLFFTLGVRATSMQLTPLLILYIPLMLWQAIVAFWLQQYNIDPVRESGLLLRGKIITMAAWPVYFLAFLGVISGKRLTYAVTPKGRRQRVQTPLILFLPHVILGTITGIDISLAFITGRTAPFLLLWAALNTALMYGLVIQVIVQRLNIYLRGRTVSMPRLTIVRLVNVFDRA